MNGCMNTFTSEFAMEAMNYFMQYPETRVLVAEMFYQVETFGKLDPELEQVIKDLLMDYARLKAHQMDTKASVVQSTEQPLLH